MEGKIGEFIASSASANVELRRQIFHSRFHEVSGWRAHLRSHLNSTTIRRPRART